MKKLGKYFLIGYLIQALSGVAMGIGFVVYYGDQAPIMLMQTVSQMQGYLPW